MKDSEKIDLYNKYIHYNPDTGSFKWKIHRNFNARVGDEVGSTTSYGYRAARLKGHFTLIHKIAFGIMEGVIPEFIDHIDHVKSNNKWNNLRACTRSQNQMNCPPMSHNTSGYKGVCWLKRNKKWGARITINKNRIQLGLFKSKNAAALAYNEAALIYHGEFAFLNIIKES